MTLFSEEMQPAGSLVFLDMDEKRNSNRFLISAGQVEGQF